MIQLLILLTVGSLTASVLLYWALRGERSSQAELAREELSPYAELRRSPCQLTDRIFAEEDCEFVRREASPEIQRAFLSERTNNALSWIRHERDQAARLMRHYRRAVRRSAGLQPAVELRLGVEYLAFLVLCSILGVLIRVRGPFRARSLAGYAAGASGQLWALSEQFLAGVHLARLQAVDVVQSDKSS